MHQTGLLHRPGQWRETALAIACDPSRMTNSAISSGGRILRLSSRPINRLTISVLSELPASKSSTCFRPCASIPRPVTTQVSFPINTPSSITASHCDSSKRRSRKVASCSLLFSSHIREMELLLSVPFEALSPSRVGTFLRRPGRQSPQRAQPGWRPPGRIPAGLPRRLHDERGDDELSLFRHRGRRCRFQIQPSGSCNQDQGDTVCRKGIRPLRPSFARRLREQSLELLR